LSFHDAFQRRAAAKVLRVGDPALHRTQLRPTSANADAEHDREQPEHAELSFSLLFYGEDDEVIGRVGAVGDECVHDDLDTVHGLDEQEVADRRDNDHRPHVAAMRHAPLLPPTITSNDSKIRSTTLS
jgi:hypothetical protein